MGKILKYKFNIRIHFFTGGGKLTKKNFLKYCGLLFVLLLIMTSLFISAGCCSMLLPARGTSSQEDVQSAIISEDSQEGSTTSGEIADDTTATSKAPDEEQKEDAENSNDEPMDYINNFSLDNLSGEKISLSDFAGKIVVLNFWATWCPPCKAEIPDFIEVYNEYKDQGIAFLGISLDDDLNALKQFVFDNNISYPILIDNQIANVSGNWGISAIPTTFFIDKNGEIIDKRIGQIPKQELVSVLKGLLARNKA